MLRLSLESRTSYECSPLLGRAPRLPAPALLECPLATCPCPVKVCCPSCGRCAAVQATAGDICPGSGHGSLIETCRLNLFSGVAWRCLPYSIALHAVARCCMPCSVAWRCMALHLAGLGWYCMPCSVASRCMALHLHGVGWCCMPHSAARCCMPHGLGWCCIVAWRCMVLHAV